MIILLILQMVGDRKVGTLTIYFGKMFYTLFLTSESNQQNIMAIAPYVDIDLNQLNEKHGCNI